MAGALLTVLLGGCLFTNTPSTQDPGAPGPDKGEETTKLKRVSAKGKSFRQGAVGGYAKPEEAPVMANSFAADFWLDTVEVTQALYQDLMGRQPVSAASPYGAGPDHPVHGVSWYDAVLFCNARSKRLNLDTVYEYSTYSITPGGSAYAMTGLTAHLERYGFRLPTEAEWEYAAKAGAQTDFPWGGIGDSAQAGAQAWYAGNAGGACHPVATRKRNAFGLYDMAGNVMEWVNDWKGPYGSEGLEDYAGARDPGAAFEKPVKGGAYAYGITALRPSGRSATYASIPSAANEYVGFRCALGALPAPRYLAPDGRVAVTDAFSVNLPRIQEVLRGRGAKLVFVNASAASRHLAYVDFRSAPPVSREFTDFDRVFHPSLSPDGNWAAYGTRLEGSEEPGEIYVRNLDDSASQPVKVGEGHIPRWWVDPVSRDTFLVFTRSAVDNREDRWQDASTYLRRFSNGQPAGLPVALTREGAFHDGRSRDGRYLATGFRLLKQRDLKNHATTTLFTAPENGKAAGDTSQVCNVSIAPDYSGDMLFLDFGYAGPSGVVGGPYGIHAVAFLAHPTGKVARWYRAPAGEDAWNDLEWSNHREFAVAAATTPAGDQKSLYLLDLRDSVTTLLAAGTNLMQPALWVGEAMEPPSVPIPDLDYDSLGRYGEPPAFDGVIHLAMKMRIFWSRCERTEGFFLGSSQMADGLDASAITSLPSVNLAYGSSGMGGVRMLVRNYILPHAPKARVIGISVPFGWSNLPGYDPTWHLVQPGNLGFTYDSAHGYWRSPLPPGLPGILASLPIPTLGVVDSLGLVVKPTLGWGPALPAEATNTGWDATLPAYRQNLRELEDLVVELEARSIQCLFLNFPNAPQYRLTGSYASQGPSRSTAQAIAADLEALQRRHPNFHFLDYNRDGLHGYTDADAHDDSHLSAEGARKFSVALDADIRAILSHSSLEEESLP